jgi:hypothetical protein
MTRIEKILLALSCLFLFGVAASRIFSWDLFWQLQSGRHMVETGSFLSRDTFSLAADVSRWEHCWLHDILFYGAYAGFGYAGVCILKGLVVTATGIVLAATARLRGASFTAILLISIPAVFITWGAWAERPQLWTFLFFALFLLILEVFCRSGSRTIWLLPGLMVLWSNLHAGAILAFPIFLAYLAGEGGDLLLGRSRLSPKFYRRLWFVAALLPLAALCTPYATEILKSLVNAPSLGKSSGMLTQLYNVDWRPMTFAKNAGFYYALGLAATLLGAGWRTLKLRDVLLLGGLAVMGFKLERHGPFFLFAMAALLPLYADAAVVPLVARIRLRYRVWVRGGVLVLSLWVMVTMARPAYHTNGLFDLGLREWQYPVQAADYVREQELPTNLFNTYEWGGYLMWTLFPEYLVFFDGRQDSPEMFKFGLEVMWSERWQVVLDRFGVNTIVLQPLSTDDGGRFPIHARLQDSPIWALVYNDDSALVFVRKSAVPEGWLMAEEKPKAAMDDTILAFAGNMTRVAPWRYQAWWEMARIHMDRKEYKEAFAALQQYLSIVPDKKRNPAAEVYYRVLYPTMGQ